MGVGRVTAARLNRRERDGTRESTRDDTWDGVAVSGPTSRSCRRRVDLVGIGADGWTGLTDGARDALTSADVIIGAPRQLDLLPTVVAAERVGWPSPLPPAVGPLLARHADRALAVLASGDPMHYGIGRLLVRHLGPDGLRVHAHPSSISLACARLGWAVEDVAVVSAVGRDLHTLAAALYPGRRVLVLSSGSGTPAQVAALLTDSGFGDSTLTVLGDLEGASESRRSGTASGWGVEREQVPPLNVVAIETRRSAAPSERDGGADGETARLHLGAGLPDSAYETDGQLTKWEVRALTLAALAPAPGDVLWDIGGGTGTIGIEWMRAHPSCRAIAVERREDRAARIERNAAALGVPGLRVVRGAAPQALGGLVSAPGSSDPDAPDAIFVGGGLGVGGVFEACWRALRPGGRLVANTVTLESEALLIDVHARLGGRLVRLEVSRAEPIGGYTGWVPARPVTQWSVIKSDPPIDGSVDESAGESALQSGESA